MSVALINHSILSWARERAQLGLEQLAEKSGIGSRGARWRSSSFLCSKEMTWLVNRKALNRFGMNQTGISVMAPVEALDRR